MNDLAVALLSAEIKQLIAMGALGIVLVVVLIAASLYNNTRVFGQSQKQAFAFQGELLALYKRTSDVQARQNELQQLLSERIEQQSRVINRIDERTAEYAQQLVALQGGDARVINHLDAVVLTSVQLGFEAQTNQMQNMRADVITRLDVISGKLNSLQELLANERAFEMEMSEQCERYWRDSQMLHERILSAVLDVVESIKQLEERDDELGTGGDGGDGGASGCECAAGVHQHAACGCGDSAGADGGASPDQPQH